MQCLLLFQFGHRAISLGGDLWVSSSVAELKLPASLTSRLGMGFCHMESTHQERYIVKPSTSCYTASTLGIKVLDRLLRAILCTSCLSLLTLQGIHIIIGHLLTTGNYLKKNKKKTVLPRECYNAMYSFWIHVFHWFAHYKGIFFLLFSWQINPAIPLNCCLRSCCPYPFV